MISLGPTLSVRPAASVPLTAAERGIPYVIVNEEKLSRITIRPSRSGLRERWGQSFRWLWLESYRTRLRTTITHRAPADGENGAEFVRIRATG